MHSSLVLLRWQFYGEVKRDIRNINDICGITKTIWLDKGRRSQCLAWDFNWTSYANDSLIIESIEERGLQRIIESSSASKSPPRAIKNWASCGSCCCCVFFCL